MIGMASSENSLPVRLIAIDLDGTLLGSDGQVSLRNITVLKAAQAAGVQIVIATGRRHTYALKVLRSLELPPHTLLVTSNGAVVRTVASELIDRTHINRDEAIWLCGHLGEFRNGLVITFDKVGPGGEDTRGSLVIEELADLHASIDPWMKANEPYLALVKPIEDSLLEDVPVQMMLCGTLDRMRQVEEHLLASGKVSPVDEAHTSGLISLARTETPTRDLAIVDILPAGCSKGAAVLRLATERGILASQIMAIGDNWNDLSMLEIAGFPTLMANAPADLKNIAAERNWTLAGHHAADGVGNAVDDRLGLTESAMLTTHA